MTKARSVKSSEVAPAPSQAEHGPKVVCYVGGPGEPYYKPHIQCLCGWHTENGGPRSWEEAGQEFDEHLAETG
jgi:hypothetical protein